MQILTIVMGFLVICCGITILQMSKIDPQELSKLDRKSTLLLQAARKNTQKFDEKDLTGIEDPGVDSIRGSFGPIGSMIRARSARRLSQSSNAASASRSRHGVSLRPHEDPLSGLQRHQLYDAPVPTFSMDGSSDHGTSIFASSGHSPNPRTPTIKYATEDIVHKYKPTSSGSAAALHELRDNSHRSISPGALPPILEGSVDGLPLQHPRPHHALSIPPVVTSIDPEAEAGLRTATAATFSGGPRGPRLRDPFADSPTSTAPSSTYSGGSGGSIPPAPRSRFVGEEDGSQAAWRHERGPRPQAARAASDHRYPKSGGDEDKEESISLVRSPSVESYSTDDDDAKRGGIRLVEPPPGRF